MASPGEHPKGVDKHAEVLRAALRVFARGGDAGTTLRAVATEAGLSPAGLRHYFRTRDDMLTAVLRSIDQPYETSWRPHGVRLAPDELLAAALRRNQRQPERVSLYLTLLAATVDPRHPATRYFRTRFQRWRTMIADDVREQQELGAIPDRIDAEYVARALLAAAEGIQSQWLADRTVDVGQHVRHVWRGLIA